MDFDDAGFRGWLKEEADRKNEADPSKRPTKKVSLGQVVADARRVAMANGNYLTLRKKNGLPLKNGSLSSYKSAFMRYVRYKSENNCLEDSYTATEITYPSILNVPETERAALMRARVGQGLYRERQLKKWKNQCAVTGIEYPDILKASHVKPWKLSNNAERLDVENGLLLIPNLDTAFDRGFVTFEDDGTIRIVESFLPIAALLGFDRFWKLSKLTSELKAYLEFHRGYIFRSVVLE